MKKTNDTKNTVEKSSVARTPSTANLKYFILAGCLLIVLFLIGFFVTKGTGFAGAGIPVRNIEDVECLKKGNVCTAEELKDGIKVRYKVNKSETYEFYVISNDENQMNLMLDKNIIANHVWGFLVDNTKGPGYSLYKMNDKIKDWTSVPYLDNYTYVDFGYQYYSDVCVDKTKEDKEFDCNRYTGYKSIVIKEGDARINYNSQPPKLAEGESEEDLSAPTYRDIVEIKLRARMITFEEVLALYSEKQKNIPNWLVENVRLDKMYWTMSTVPYAVEGYDKSAYTIVNRNGKADIASQEVSIGNPEEEITVDDYNVGLRPVITLNKK